VEGADLSEIARHLTDTIYNYRQTADRLSQAPPTSARSPVLADEQT